MIRPLLDQKKDELIFISKYVFDFYIQDPSNEDEKFQRTKIRKLIKNLQDHGLDKKKFIQTIKNLKYSNSVVKYYVNENLKKNTFYSVNKNEFILNNEFFQQPHEIIFRTLSEAIQIVGKKYYSVRGKKIDKIINQIVNNELFRATLRGCIIEKVNQTVIISKEH